MIAWATLYSMCVVWQQHSFYWFPLTWILWWNKGSYRDNQLQINRELQFKLWIVSWEKVNEKTQKERLTCPLNLLWRNLIRFPVAASGPFSFLSFPLSVSYQWLSPRFPNLQSPSGPKRREPSHTHITAPEKQSTWTKERQLLRSRELNLRSLDAAIKDRRVGGGSWGTLSPTLRKNFLCIL